MPTPETVQRFGRLFKGRTDAWGTGKGAVVRGNLRETHYAAHLAGLDPGLGIFPLLDDGRCYFAAVDLDKPDLESAKTISELLPPKTFIERSRSGNYHVWAFFEEGIEAWIPRALMKHVCAAVLGPKERPEIFPKQDTLRPGMVGNYINLPFHGKDRPILRPDDTFYLPGEWLSFDKYSDPARWHMRCERLGLGPSAVKASGREFGTRANLHECAVYILNGIETGERPLMEGHRHIVLFNLAKMLLDYEGFDEAEAWDHLSHANAVSPEPVNFAELRRIFNNAKRGRYTSTGCDDPVMAPYVSPTCPIARQT